MADEGLKERALRDLVLKDDPNYKDKIYSSHFWKRGNVGKRFSGKKWVIKKKIDSNS